MQSGLGVEPDEAPQVCDTWHPEEVPASQDSKQAVAFGCKLFRTPGLPCQQGDWDEGMVQETVAVKGVPKRKTVMQHGPS